MSRREYTEETKGAVMAALLTGQSVSSVARQYQIPKGTVNGWKRQAGAVATQKEGIGDALLGYVADAIATLRAQLRVCADENWLRRQPASEIAVLHGVLADKTIRLLEGIADSAQDREDV